MVKAQAVTKLAVRPKTPSALTKDMAKRSGEFIVQNLAELARAFSGKGLSVEVQAESYSILHRVNGILDDTMEIAKATMKTLVQEHGEKTTEKGSMAATIGGYLYEMRPTRTGTDPKKFEALLRAKGLAVELFMDAVLTYKFSESKAGAGIGGKYYTADELASCAYDASFALQAPKKGGE